jgi:hypothetical protein
VLVVVASSCDPEKFCTILDRVPRYNGSRITSLHHQGDRKASSLSNPKTVVGGSRDICDLRDLCDLPGQLC